MPAREDVIATIEANSTILGNFNQSAPDRAWTHEELAEGYCRGVCLDWIRRVMQGGRPSFEPKSPVNRAEHVHQQSTRQGNAWLQYYHVERDENRIRNARIDSNRSAAMLNRELIDIYNADLTRGPGDDVVLAGNLGARIIEFGLTWPGANSRIQAGTLQEIIQSLNGRPQARSAAQLHTDAWGRFRATMDEQFDTQRGEEDRAVSGRRFSMIDLVVHNEVHQYVSTAAMTTAIINVNEYSAHAGRSMIIGFKMDKVNGGSTGHALALFHNQAGQHILLDPNYGMYRFASIAAAGGILNYLFNDVYIDADYGAHVNNRMQSEVFALTG